MGEGFPLDLNEVYSRLLDHFGPQGWWPGETSEEHLAGCVLAQNTRWDRVEPVIARLRNSGLLLGSKLLDVSLEELAECLKGSGTYRRKAEYLQNVWAYMTNSGWDGTPESVTRDTSVIRQELLSVKGVGQETCDCILLYVLERPVFVVDAYTKRILSRHGFCRDTDTCSVVQEIFHKILKADVEVFKEYHALLVACAKEYCRPVPRCRGCPLSEGEVC